ncbi:Shedu anti-phage system protein SduA domain-containing protein [Maribacter sp. 4G9]|uniref:Shedu anti-phage system protein SduA domain-containing protein n=1 Tax=Maribacter sp. 4G9 TaxID=1889777 RepID=UPI000C14EFC9|nr:Shedu anti-phage system protein SduA domain-containing protein [Maribacter sp. 4G9]PIB27166.1 hypothetical protein BFP75_07645 [Maribacter sp. 4G9]
MTYEFTENAPKPIDKKEYVLNASEKLDFLLKNFADDETKFQTFFELNPSFMPGARDEFSIMGQSGHEPFSNCLISQPKISGIINRIPDFMWLANDSAYFTPVIIEIEAPSKKHFRKDGNPTSHFVGFPKNRTVHNSNLLTLNSNCHDEKQQV